MSGQLLDVSRVMLEVAEACDSRRIWELDVIAEEIELGNKALDVD